jgi:hypothetical protein
MMKTIVYFACIAAVAALAATAQAQTSSTTTDKSGYSTGRTQTPETVGEKQPQGNTGPINTGTGGAPPESPQGQSPPGMQPAPEGSGKTVVSPEAKDGK